MASDLKLIYFNSRGAAENARLLLKYAGIEFEDVRIKQEDWPQMKDTTPFGQLPVLENNGKRVNQSLAIARYCGKLAKLGGHDDWEDLEIDAVADTVRDFWLKLTPYFYEKDEEKKKTIKETANKETCPYYLSRLEAIVKKGGHLALGRLTWVDFYFATVSAMFDFVTGNDAVADYPNLKALGEKVNQLPAIKEWIEIRPKTDY